MVEILVVIREPGALKPDYSLKFSVPALPRPGDYISIHRPNKPDLFGEDCIVRRVWWRLEHPETAPVATGAEKIGGVIEIFVECDPAIGPYASDSWRISLEERRQEGLDIENFEVERFAVRERDIEG